MFDLNSTLQGIFIIISIVIMAIAFIGWFEEKENNNLLNSTTHKNRGNPSELALVKTLLKKGIHPDAIFHDLYLQKRNGTFSQIDVVVATAVGLIVIEVKDYSGWIFGSGDNQNWTQVLAYGREKYDQLTVLHLGTHADAAAFGLGLQAVADGVFNQALQHHGRKAGAAQALGHLQVKLQALFHAHTHEL